MLHRIATIFLLIAFAWGDTKVTATVDRDRISINENVVLTVTVESDKGAKAPLFPDTDKWAVVGTSSHSSTSIQIIGTRMVTQKTMSYIFVLSPQDTGVLIIPSIKVNVDGDQFNTKPIQVWVTGNGGSTVPSQMGQPQQTPQIKTAPRDEVFVSLVPSKDTVYIGEQVTISAILYSRVDILNIAFERDVEASGFWTEVLYEAKQLRMTPTTINGKRYYSLELKRFAAFPISSGKSNISPMELRVVVRRPPRDFFDMFGRQDEIRVKSDAPTITVLPLPSGQPKNFSGAVGWYTITAKVDRQEVPVGEALTYSITVSGDGNINRVKIESPPIPADFEIYDRSETSTKKTRGNIFGGEKKLELILVPRTEGDYTIPPVEFSFFDPQKKTFTKISTNESIPIKVTKGKGIVSGKVSSVGRSVVESIGDDIQYIMPDAISINVGIFEKPSSVLSLWFLLVELAVLLGAVFWRRRQVSIFQNWESYIASKALVESRKRLKESAKLKDPVAGLSAISDTIYWYFAARLSIDSGAIIFDEVSRKLYELGAPMDAIRELKIVLDDIDRARFSPEGCSINHKQVSKDVEKLISEIDKGLRK